jgi:hypothetical protein
VKKIMVESNEVVDKKRLGTIEEVIRYGSSDASAPKKIAMHTPIPGIKPHVTNDLFRMGATALKAYYKGSKEDAAVYLDKYSKEKVTYFSKE